jgi:hypothetical protein
MTTRGYRLRRVPRWAWFGAAAFLCGWLPVVLALVVHNHGSQADPYCLRHCYTLVHVVGAGILAFVAAPVVISLLVLGLISRHGTRHRRPARRAAWTLAILSCLICFTALITSVGIAMLPPAALTVCALASAPPLHP